MVHEKTKSLVLVCHRELCAYGMGCPHAGTLTRLREAVSHHRHFIGDGYQVRWWRLHHEQIYTK